MKKIASATLLSVATLAGMFALVPAASAAPMYNDPTPSGKSFGCNYDEKNHVEAGDTCYNLGGNNVFQIKILCSNAQWYAGNRAARGARSAASCPGGSHLVTHQIDGEW